MCRRNRQSGRRITRRRSTKPAPCATRLSTDRTSAKSSSSRRRLAIREITNNAIAGMLGRKLPGADLSERLMKRNYWILWVVLLAVSASGFAQAGSGGQSGTPAAAGGTGSEGKEMGGY